MLSLRVAFLPEINKKTPNNEERNDMKEKRNNNNKYKGKILFVQETVNRLKPIKLKEVYVCCQHSFSFLQYLLNAKKKKGENCLIRGS